MDDKQKTKLSKFLSLVLRHEPGRIGISLDAQGWIGTDDLLAACLRHGTMISRAQLAEIVETSDKKRFAISNDGLRIRANQGHSVEVELDHPQAAPPAVLFHGTVERFVDSIRRLGLIKGDRHDVHLSETVETAAKVGERRGKPVILPIRAAEMHAAGFVFRRTPNDVWLVDHVPAEYIDFSN